MKINIATLQLTATEDKNDNLAKTAKKIQEAAEKGAHVICLQELFATIYFCYEENEAFFDWAEEQQGETKLLLAKLAKELNVVIISSFFEKRAKGLYHNSVKVFDAGGADLGLYRKTHIPDDPGFYEKYYFTPGENEYKIFSTKYGEIGVLICWDQWYPEAARLTALKGADFLFYPTAIGWEPQITEDLKKEEYEAWQTIQRAHGIANGLHVVAVNRTGHENGTDFWGGSFISGPFGKVIYQAPHHAEEVAVTTIDLEETEKTRRRWPFLRDRRIELYNNINSRYLDNE